MLARIRPGESESSIEYAAARVEDVTQLQLRVPAGAASGEASLSFAFDHVFGERATQEEVYARMVAPLVADVLQGFNATTFAYGQTGSGKVGRAVRAARGIHRAPRPS